MSLLSVLADHVKASDGFATLAYQRKESSSIMIAHQPNLPYGGFC